MSTIAIAVDAARDAAKRASDDADESYYRRRDRVTTEIAFSAHAAACSLVLAWDKAKNEVIQRTVNARMREQS